MSVLSPQMIRPESLRWTELDKCLMTECHVIVRNSNNL